MANRSNFNENTRVQVPPSHLYPRFPVANANERTSNNKEQ